MNRPSIETFYHVSFNKLAFNIKFSWSKTIRDIWNFTLQIEPKRTQLRHITTCLPGSNLQNDSQPGTIQDVHDVKHLSFVGHTVPDIQGRNHPAPRTTQNTWGYRWLPVIAPKSQGPFMWENLGALHISGEKNNARLVLVWNHGCFDDKKAKKRHYSSTLNSLGSSQNFVLCFGNGKNWRLWGFKDIKIVSNFVPRMLWSSKQTRTLEIHERENAKTPHSRSSWNLIDSLGYYFCVDWISKR